MLPEVRLQLVVNGEYRAVADGSEVGGVFRVDGNRWKIRLKSDPANRKRRSLPSLKMARQQILAVGGE